MTVCPHCGEPERDRTLTEKEKEVGKWLMQGMGNPEIAAKVGLSLRMVKAYIQRMTRKMRIEPGGSPRVKLAVKLYEESQSRIV